MLHALRRDLVFALRTLRANPGFTLAAVLALALGIGANTTVFSVINAILAFPVPFDDPDRAVFVLTENAELGVTQNGASADELLDWQEQSRSFDHLLAAEPASYNVTGAGDPVQVTALRSGPGFFEMTGSHLAHGRPFREEEARPGNDGVVIVSHGFWQNQLGGDLQAIGRQISLDGRSHTVVGIAEEGFFFPNPGTTIYVPLVLERGAQPRTVRSLFAIGRLAAGIDAATATAELQTVAERLAAEHPDSNRGWTVRVQTLRDNLNAGAGFGMVVLYTAITFVLLIACANVANLLLARATARAREIALRTTLGAGRLRLLRQLLTESLVLALLGGGAGLGLSVLGIEVLRDLLAPSPQIGFIASRITMNGPVVLHALAISLLAGVAFGLVPALGATRRNLRGALADGGRGGSAGRRGRLGRSVLITAEVALALGLLGASFALVRAFNHIYSADPGFDTRGLVAFPLNLPASDYPDDLELAAFYDELDDRLAQLPGVADAMLTTSLPLTAFPGVATTVATVEGAAVEQRADQPNANHIAVGAGYLERLGVEVVRGRGIDERDRDGSLPVAVVTETAARQLWPDQDPLERRVRLASPAGETEWLTVVGVTRDVQTTAHSLRATRPLPTLFVPLAQQPRRSVSVLVRSDLDAAGIAPGLRQAVWAIDRNLPVENVLTLEQTVERLDTQNRFFARVLTGLSLIALLLAGVGIYAVISFAVQQRVQEIGIRVALGARPLGVVLLVVRQAAILTLVGVAIGSILAVSLVRLLGSQLQGMAAAGAGGPATFVAVALVILAVAHVASLVPARRALRVDPVVALRES
jgi:putative ABC transport system permease protein